MAKICPKLKNAKEHQIIIEKSGINRANDGNGVMCNKNKTNRPHIENDNEIDDNDNSVTKLNVYSVIIDQLSDIPIKDLNMMVKNST